MAFAVKVVNRAAFRVSAACRKIRNSAEFLPELALKGTSK